MSRSDLQAMFNIAVAAAANHVRPAPLAIEDGSERLTRMEAKLDGVKEAAVQNLVDNAEEHCLEELAVEKMIENDGGALEEKAIEQIIKDDIGGVEKQAVQKLKRRIENLQSVIKRLRTEAKTAPPSAVNGGEIVSTLMENDQWRRETRMPSAFAQASLGLAHLTANVSGGEVVSTLLANSKWRQETIAEVIADETARAEMIDALADSHRAQVEEDLEEESDEADEDE